LNWLQFVVAALELPPDPRERQFWARLARFQLIYSLAGLVFGLTCIAGGIGLFLHGVVGTSSWIGDFIGVQSRLSDAAPGTVLFIVGLAVVWLTRFTVRIRRPIEIELRPPRQATSRRDSEHRRKAS
jgi:hypothetical protein